MGWEMMPLGNDGVEVAEEKRMEILNPFVETKLPLSIYINSSRKNYRPVF